MQTVEPQTYGTPRRRRRARWPMALTIFLVVVLGLLVVADRVAASVANDRIAGAVNEELASRGFQTSSTDVTVGGFPFLTQVAKGHYDRITIDLTGVRGERGRMPRLTVVAHDVDADTKQVIDGTAKVTAATVTGDGLVDWSTLAGLVDYNVPNLEDVAFSSDRGRLRLRVTAVLASQRVPLTAVADFAVSKGVLHVQVRDAEAVGVTLIPLAQQALDDLERRLTADVDLDRLPLPFQLVVDRVTVQDDGLSVAATATNVPIAGRT